jgi:hypothetical protein
MSAELWLRSDEETTDATDLLEAFNEGILDIGRELLVDVLLDLWEGLVSKMARLFRE